MSKLLLDEQPLMVMPKLAAKIGLNEAIILQQIHYWNEINKKADNNYRDGYYWTFNSVKQWMEHFPFWSKNTIQRTITNLENMKLIVTGNYNKLKIDRTKWYRIDYKVLEALETSPFTQIGSTNTPEWCNHLSKLGLPLPEINSENNTESNKKDRGQNFVVDRLTFLDYKNLLKDQSLTTSQEHQLEALKRFVECYETYMESPHPKLTIEQWEKAHDSMLYIESNGIDHEFDVEDEEEMIYSYFETEFNDCNYSVLHYISGDLRAVRFYDVIY